MSVVNDPGSDLQYLLNIFILIFVILIIFMQL